MAKLKVKKDNIYSEAGIEEEVEVAEAEAKGGEEVVTKPVIATPAVNIIRKPSASASASSFALEAPESVRISKDITPHTIEELVIKEYYEYKEKAKELKTKLDEEKDLHEKTLGELRGKLEEEAAQYKTERDIYARQLKDYQYVVSTLQEIFKIKKDGEGNFQIGIVDDRLDVTKDPNRAAARLELLQSLFGGDEGSDEAEAEAEAEVKAEDGAGAEVEAEDEPIYYVEDLGKNLEFVTDDEKDEASKAEEGNETKTETKTKEAKVSNKNKKRNKSKAKDTKDIKGGSGSSDGSDSI